MIHRAELYRTDEQLLVSEQTSFLKLWIDFYIYFVREYKTMFLSSFLS